jgi:hypothetical protein
MRHGNGSKYENYEILKDCLCKCFLFLFIMTNKTLVGKYNVKYTRQKRALCPVRDTALHSS